MDAQPAQAALSDQPFLVTAQPGSPLAALLDRRDMAQAREAEAKAEAAGLTAEIKNELTLACGCDHPLVKPGGWITRKRSDGNTEWIPPPHLDHGQPRTNDFHHPEELLGAVDQDDP